MLLKIRSSKMGIEYRCITVEVGLDTPILTQDMHQDHTADM